MDESTAPETPGKTYRTRGVMRAAQHRFLFLGIGVVVIIAAILALLNQSVKEETKFQQQLERQVRSGIVSPQLPEAGLAYEHPEQTEPAPIAAEEPTPAADASPEPTSPDTPAE